MGSIRISTSARDVASLGRAAGFDLGFRQLDSGPQAIPATFQLGAHMILVRMTFNRAYHQLGSPPEGMTTFGVPIRGLRNWLGRDYEASSLLPFNVSGGFDSVSESGFQGCTLSVSNAFVRSISESCQIPIADVLQNPSTDTVIANSRPTQFFRFVLSSLFEDTEAQLSPEVEDELIIALLNASRAAEATQDNSKPVSRSRAVSKALSYINETSGEAIGVRDICTNTGVALRTLNRAFRERFGVGPKAYLVRQRLSSVRAELLRVPADTHIAAVANGWGFWHMGQFAKDYRATFGELPSETIRQSQPGDRLLRVGEATRQLRSGI